MKSITNNTAGSSNGRTPDFDSGNDGSSPSPASMPDLERLRTVVIPMMRELVRACSSDFDINRFYMSIPARPDRDADLIMSDAIKYLEQLALMGWVPVSERLPDSMLAVLGFCDDGIGEDIVFYDRVEDAWWSNRGNEERYVTFWARLPPIPGEN